MLDYGIMMENADGTYSSVVDPNEQAQLKQLREAKKKQMQE